jgi:hypothetical protein
MGIAENYRQQADESDAEGTRFGVRRLCRVQRDRLGAVKGFV